MELGPEGERRIKAWEACAFLVGLLYFRYLDIAKKWTIAWGHLLTAQEIANDVFGRGLTRAECDALFVVDVQRYVDAVNRALRIVIGQHAFDALVTLCYNIGTAGLEGSTVVRLINAGADAEHITAAWCMWDHVTKDGALVEDPGLRRRRLDEVALFFDPDAEHEAPDDEERDRQRSLEVAASPEEVHARGAAAMADFIRQNDFGARAA